MSKAKIFFISILSIFSLVKCYGHKENKTRVIMFVFGDSLFDPGNNIFLNRSLGEKADHWPYGETFFHFPTGRFCDGRIVPDFLAMELGLPLWKPYLGPNGIDLRSISYGANFASAGARAVSTNSPTKQQVIDLPEQVEFFKNVAKELREELGEAEANKTLREAIYLSSIGGVDYEYYYSENSSNSTELQRQQFIQLVIGNLTNAIKEIYETGGRKFAFQNVGPVGCLPLMKQYFGLNGTDKCVEGALNMAKQHNAALLETAQVLETTLEGFKYSTFDYYGMLYDIIKNHTKYGFEVADVQCCAPEYGTVCGVGDFELCSNASEYVFFDWAHPVERVNVMLSQLIWNGGPTVTTPRNFKQLSELDISSDDTSLFRKVLRSSFGFGYGSILNSLANYFTIWDAYK